MLGEFICKGFKAIVVSHCAIHDGLLYLRVLAPPTADKAIWAVLNSSKARRGQYLSNAVLRWQEDEDPGEIKMMKGVRYLTPRVALDCGYTDMAFLHPDLTAGADRIFYLLAGEQTPPPAFFPMLNARMALPLLPEWAGWLWREGLEGYLPPGANQWRVPKLIEPVRAKGTAIFRVNAGPKTTPYWLAVIRRGLGFDPARWEQAKEKAA